MTAEGEAARLLPHLLEQCRELRAAYGHPVETPISVYETDDDLATLRPEDRGRWTAAFHREVMECIARRLRLHGHRVRLIPLDAASYLRWLAETKQKNTPATRAQFIGLQA